MRRRAEPSKRAAAACLAALLPALAGAAGPAPAAVCDKPVYLTFDTGHMGVAPLVADVLARHHVKVTFFLANERIADRRRQPGRPVGALVEGARRRGPCLRLAHLRPRLLAGRPAGRQVPRQAQRRSADGQGPDLDRAAVLRRNQALVRALHADDRPRHAAPVPRAGRQDLAGAAQGGARMRLRARGLGAGRFPGRRAAQRQTSTPACWSRRCATSSPATSCWPTWASGRARTPGPPPCWSRWLKVCSARAIVLPPWIRIRPTRAGSLRITDHGYA